MRGIGWFTTLVAMAVGAAAAVIAVKSIPDIKRYLRMRDM